MPTKKKHRKKVCIPHFGRYTSLFKSCLEEIGVSVVLPPKITDRTVKIGTKHSSEMMCFPYKVTLGNFIETLEEDPDIDCLIMFDSRGTCRFRHYNTLQKQTLFALGFKTKMLPLNSRNLLTFHREIAPRQNPAKLARAYWKLFQGIKKFPERVTIKTDKPNLLIIGEIYTCVEPSVNFDIERKVEALGCNPINAVTLGAFVSGGIKSLFSKTRFRGKYHEKAQRYLNGPLGGHGIENIASILKWMDLGVDGIIWLRPLSCMPESTVDLVVKGICQEKDLPLLVFDIDESNFSLNIATRLETFAEQIGALYEERKLLHRV